MSAQFPEDANPASAALLQSALGGGGGAPQGGPSADDLLDTAIKSLTGYIQATGSDDVETATAAQCLAKLQSIKATNQKNHESAMGTTPAHKAVAKNASAAGGGY